MFYNVLAYIYSLDRNYEYHKNDFELYNDGHNNFQIRNWKIKNIPKPTIEELQNVEKSKIDDAQIIYAQREQERMACQKRSEFKNGMDLFSKKIDEIERKTNQRFEEIEKRIKELEIKDTLNKKKKTNK